MNRVGVRDPCSTRDGDSRSERGGRSVRRGGRREMRQIQAAARRTKGAAARRMEGAAHSERGGSCGSLHPAARWGGAGVLPLARRVRRKQIQEMGAGGVKKL